MKPICRMMMMVFIAMLAVSLISCGADDEDDVDKDTDKEVEEYAFDFVGTTWKVMTVNGVTFDQLFQPAEPVEYETEFMLGENSWTFNADGTLKGALEFVVTEKYPEPVSSMTQNITIASTATYTADESMLTIDTNKLDVDVVVTLEPKEVWEERVVEGGVERLEMDLAAETEKGFGPTVTGALFKPGTEFTWSIEGEMLTLMGTIQQLGLVKVAE